MEILKIEQFISKMFQEETDAKNATESFNNIFSNKYVNNFYYSFSESIHDRMGMIIRSETSCNEPSDEKLDNTYKHLRNLFKISHYKNEIYGDIFLCYTSGFISNDFMAILKSMTDCFIVSKIGDKLQIINHSGIDPETNKWIGFAGNDNIRLSSPGKIIQVKRFEEPIHDDDNMKRYQANV